MMLALHCAERTVCEPEHRVRFALRLCASLTEFAQYSLRFCANLRRSRFAQICTEGVADVHSA